MSLTGIEKLRECPKISKIKGNNEKAAVELGWTRVEGAEKYSVRRSEGEKGDFEHIAWSKKLKYVDETVEPYKTYHYKILAWKKLEGKKTSTKISSARAVIISDVPVPKNVVPTPCEDGSVSIKWDKVKGAKEYIVLRRNDLCSDLLPVGITDKCSFRDEDIVSGQPYYYGIQAVKYDGDERKPGKWSKQLPVVCLDKGEITDIRASFGKRINLSFRIVAGADGYIIERADDKNGEFIQVGTTEGQTAVEFSDKVPASFRTYRYRVRAYKNVEQNQFTALVCAEKSIKSK